MDHDPQFCPPCASIFKGMEREEEMGEEERRGEETESEEEGYFRLICTFSIVE